MLDQLPKINLAIIAITPLVRLGMSQLIQDLQPGFRPVLVVSSLFDVWEKLEQADITTLLVELSGTPMEQLGTAQQLLRLQGDRSTLNIVVYTACRNVEILLLLAHRPISLIAHHEPLEQLRQDLVSALVHGKVYSPGIKRHLNQAKSPKRLSSNTLTHSERNVLEQLLTGVSVTDIAARYQRSIKTISAHKCSCMRKLGARSDAELFLFSQRPEFNCFIPTHFATIPDPSL